MEKTMHESARRLFEAARKVRPEIEGPADLARALNQSEQVINNWSRRKTGVSKEGRLLAQKLLGVSATWIEDGTGSMLAAEGHISGQHGVSDKGQRDDLISRLLPAEKGNVVAWERPEDLEPDENRVWIDRYDYHFSAGTGLIQWEIRQKKALPFDIGFFKSLGSKPKDCKLLTVRGDSMEPFLFNRDMMMVDSSRVNVRDGQVYAIYFEDEPLVKQIFKQVGGGIVLHSYNAKYPDRLVPPASMELIKIIGEVIYRSGSAMAGGN
ncbi:S24 family peptidase [Paraburkholderia caballeronis]|uniref:Peptidase S24-like n=1 Tax=Paraburkholderia caballeronis TaxID=416943 RepID=A0A1H7U000_9BURK|nr:S24 family peptidase [Paraburkholderia caballeronis]PXW23384.1 peptidase S24-like protein [Paraburkholderia caballeronis]PXW98377.1 peptidase S24-like protein [Paraburkholderia caballeronis]RAJ95108.1 peptidase S24-like protein [Paraburkholderia caballeronis]SEC56771.1 Peptidase S24-like [Paraburkholderia caballeronis]SEL89557.1 Peptidase S24-like [Paraburkholderia caballeronis]